MGRRTSPCIIFFHFSRCPSALQLVVVVVVMMMQLMTLLLSSSVVVVVVAVVVAFRSITLSRSPSSSILFASW